MAATEFKLNTGQRIPAVGLGTWKNENAKESVVVAIKNGFGLIDCAWIYDNEAQVGEGLKEVFAAGVRREDVFVVSKLWSTYHQRVEDGLNESLKLLGLDYVDAYLLHWPVCLNAKGNDPRMPTLPNGRRDIIKDYSHLVTWKAMEALLTTGKTKSIGVCNYSKRFLEELLAVCKVVPAINQVELHPFLPQDDVLELCKEKGIHVMAYSPFGSTGAPLMKAEPIVNIAKKYSVSPATVLLSYHVNRGCTVVAKSSSPERIVANKHIIKLESEDMTVLSEYSGELKQNGQFKRHVIPNWGFDFGFPDQS